MKPSSEVVKVCVFISYCSSSFTSCVGDTLWPWLAGDKFSSSAEGSIFAPYIFAMLTECRWQRYFSAVPSWHNGNASKPKEGDFCSKGGILEGGECYLRGFVRKRRRAALKDTCRAMAACRLLRKRLLSKTILSQLWRRTIFLITSLCSVSCSICRSASFIKTCSVKGKFINNQLIWAFQPPLEASSQAEEWEWLCLLVT